MDESIRFIFGVPRSGSTLLAANLRQNPREYTDRVLTTDTYDFDEDGKA